MAELDLDFAPWHVWVFGAGHVGRAIVDAYAVGGVTRGRLAELVGVTESVVVAALRRR